MKVLGGLLIMAVGMTITIKSEWFLQNFGTVPWAEEHMGMSGGTRLFYRLLGIAVAFVGILLATGLLQGLMLGTVGKLFVPPNQR